MENNSHDTETNLVTKVMKLYDIKSLEEFSERIDVPLSTLKTWRGGKISRMGEILLNLMIENYGLRKKVNVATHFFETFSNPNN